MRILPIVYTSILLGKYMGVIFTVKDESQVNLQSNQSGMRLPDGHLVRIPRARTRDDDHREDIPHFISRNSFCYNFEARIFLEIYTLSSG